MVFVNLMTYEFGSFLMFRNILFMLCALIATSTTYAQDCGSDKTLVFKDGKKDCASNYQKFVTRTSTPSGTDTPVPILELYDQYRLFSFADSFCGVGATRWNASGGQSANDSGALNNCNGNLGVARRDNPERYKDCKCELVLSAQQLGKNFLKIDMTSERFSEKYKSSIAPPVSVQAKTEAVLAAKVPAPVQAFVSAPRPEVMKAEPPIRSANQTNPVIAQSPNKSAAQITSNPIDTRRPTSTNEVWLNLNPSIAIQQRQFCRVLENFRVARSNAEATKNEIRVNLVYRELSQSLNALMPDGKFQNWILRADSVTQASDGSAEVFLELPCGVYIGSNACDKDPKKFYGTAPEGSMLYTELSKITSNDFVVASGEFFFADSKTFDKGRSVASFRMIKAANHCRAKEVPADSDFYGAKISIISTIK